MSPGGTMEWTAAGLARQVQSGALSAREVVQVSLERIGRLDPVLGAFLSVLPDQALARADVLDARRARGEFLGPLAGVPVAIKDNICLQGAPCTCASRILEGYRPAYDATVVERLAAADAVIVGKTNLDEFSMGSSTETSARRITRNPWDLTRVPGGSSGGSAAAVASGMVPLALGSDTGGSVRQPAAFCGVAGLKPTYGRVSRYGLVAFASSLEQIGPLAGTVADLALALQVIGGPDARDATTEPASPGTYDLESGIKGRVIAFPDTVLDRPGLSPEVAAATRRAAAVLESLGGRIEAIDFPDLDAGIAAYYLVCTAEASSNLARYDGVRYGPRAAATDLASLYASTRGRGFGREVKRRIMLGTYALRRGYCEAYYGRAMHARRVLKNRFKEIFRRADLILIPTSPTPAFRIGEKIDDSLEMYLADVFTVFPNLIGSPALTLPGGFTRSGLPLGIQLVADEFQDGPLLAAGQAFTSATEFRRDPPPIPGASP